MPREPDDWQTFHDAGAPADTPGPSYQCMDTTSPDYLVLVWWDPVLETFGCYVDDAAVPQDEEACLCWRGTSPADLVTLEHLCAVLRPYAQIEQAVLDQLRQDGDQSRLLTVEAAQQRWLLGGTSASEGGPPDGT